MTLKDSFADTWKVIETILIKYMDKNVMEKKRKLVERKSNILLNDSNFIIAVYILLFNFLIVNFKVIVHIC